MEARATFKGGIVNVINKDGIHTHISTEYFYQCPSYMGQESLPESDTRGPLNHKSTKKLRYIHKTRMYKCIQSPTHRLVVLILTK